MKISLSGGISMRSVLHTYMLVTSIFALVKLMFIVEVAPVVLVIIAIIWVNILLNILYIINKEKESSSLEGYMVVIWAISLILLAK